MSQVFFDHKTYTKVLIALGGNVASLSAGPEKTIQAALVALQDESTRMLKTSRFYRTPCFPAGAGPDFVNAAAALETRLPPEAFLRRLHEVEQDFGRVRIQRWGERTLDLDLLAYGDRILPDRPTVQDWIDLPPDQQREVAPDRLILPHPRMQDRGFVLVPLADIAPEWRHPLLKKTVREMLEALPEADKADIQPL